MGCSVEGCSCAGSLLPEPSPGIIWCLRSVSWTSLPRSQCGDGDVRPAKHAENTNHIRTSIHAHPYIRTQGDPAGSPSWCRPRGQVHSARRAEQRAAGAAGRRRGGPAAGAGGTSWSGSCPGSRCRRTSGGGTWTSWRRGSGTTPASSASACAATTSSPSPSSAAAPLARCALHALIRGLPAATVPA